MKKLIINIAIIIVVFFISLFVAGSIINQGTTDMTMEMGKATFPVVTVRFNGIEMNPMHGYRMEPGNENESDEGIHYTVDDRTKDITSD